jgi:dihydroneopterin aldolase
MWDADRSFERVALRDVAIMVRIGAFEEERAAPQRIIVDLELFRHRGRFPERGGLDDALNYHRIFRFLTETLPEHRHVDLLEQLAETVVAFCLEDARVEACRVRLRKPAVYGGRALPQLDIYRRRDGR